MVDEHNTKLIFRKLGFSNFGTIPPENHVGGIWCLCNTNVDVTILGKESRTTHCHILDKCNGQQCILSVIYMPAQERDKEIV